jgi:hypothetical protein
MKRLLAISTLATLGCVGDIGSEPSIDSGPAPTVDSGIEPVSFALTGNVRDYAELVMLADTSIATIGLSPPIQGASDGTGAYTLPGIPPGSAFFAHVMPSGTTYRPTVNQAVTMLDADVTMDLGAVSAVYAQRQHATAGLPVAPNTSIVIVEMVKPDGTPWEAVPASYLTIEPVGGGVPVGMGPYFLGLNGDVDLALTDSIAFNGRARAAFLNVPPGSYSMYVRGVAGPAPDPGTPDAGLPLPPDAGAPLDGGVEPPPGEIELLATAAVWTASDATVHGATLVWIQKIGGMGNPGGDDPSFATDVYPLLQKASAGGQGCASCHTAGGPAALVLILDDGAPAVHARLLADPELVNLASPADSLLLTKPLYENPPNHPNATWLDTTDPSYVIILEWISAGAQM